ncbi:MAG: hypothetical protein H0T79_13965 [Deltaproteobacteria bacterium]|nr:hypothetical protein [Deltaproteobacteria bacterium]
MGTAEPDSKMAAFIAFGFVALGILIAAVQGLRYGSIAGGIIAALGAIPACFGMWKGIQQETQHTLAMSVSAVLIALATGAVLIILRVVHWVT